MWGTGYAPLRWSDIYCAWEKVCDEGSGRISVSVRKIRSDMDMQDEAGYDWVDMEQWTSVRDFLRENPEKWLNRHPAPGKGVRKTAQMLAEAKERVELAAVWICALTNDLQAICVNLWSELDFWLLFQVCSQAECFLKERHLQWHPSMRKRLPVIPYSDGYLAGKKEIDLEGIMKLCSQAADWMGENYQILSYFSNDR